MARAAGRGDRALVDALIELGADLDARSDWPNGPYTALHGLVDGPTPERLAMAEYLVERGATVDLHAAAGLGRLDRIRAILDAEPERVSEPGPDGATPLHLARDRKVAELLLERGADIDRPCVDHRSTPAMWATDGRLDVLRLLLDRGARHDLFQAVLLEDLDLVRRIVEDDPESVHAFVRPGSAHAHVGFGDKYVWTLRGADTPIELARRLGSKEIHAFLLERSSPSTRLLQAARADDGAEMARLLDGHAGLQAALTEAQTSEILAASVVGAKTLLDRGVSPHARDDQHGATALHQAAWRGDEDVVRALLEGGADPTLRDRSFDGTPAGWALHGGHEALGRLLDRHAGSSDASV